MVIHCSGNADSDGNDNIDDMMAYAVQVENGPCTARVVYVSVHSIEAKNVYDGVRIACTYAMGWMGQC